MNTATINVGHNPRGIAVDTASHTVYVANEGSDTVTPITESYNTATSQVTYTPGTPIAVGSGPVAVAVDQDTHTVWVANGDGTVSVISEATSTVIQTINVDVGGQNQGPNTVTVDTSNSTVYVSEWNGYIIAVSDQTYNVQQFYSDNGMSHLGGGAVDPAASTFFVSLPDQRTVAEISTGTGTIPAGTETGSLHPLDGGDPIIELNPSIQGYSGYLDVRTSVNPGIVIFNMVNSGVNGIVPDSIVPLPRYPFGQAVNAATDTLYELVPGAGSSQKGSVFIITNASTQAPRKNSVPVAVGKDPIAIALDTSEGPTGTIVFAANFNSNTVTAFAG